MNRKDKKLPPKADQPWAEKANQAFTLLETMIAIGVIITGIVGVLILVEQSLRSIRVADNRIIASHLAQEAVEVVVNVRNTNWVSRVGWRTGIPSLTQGIVDYDSTQVSQAVNPANFCISLVAGIYEHGTPPCDTIFSRHLEITDMNEDISGNSVDFIEVKAVVEWSQEGIDRSVTIVDHLYDWR